MSGDHNKKRDETTMLISSEEHKKTILLMFTLAIVLFFIILGAQYYTYNTLAHKLLALENQTQLQHEKTQATITQNAAETLARIQLESSIAEEGRLELERKTLENFNFLEQYITDKTTTLAVDFKEQIGTVDTQIRSLEEESNRLQSQVNSIRISSSDFTGIVEDVMEAVVSIRTDVGQASGFFFHRDGYIMTNRHVLEGASVAIAVDHLGNSFTTRLVGVGQTADLAVLKIDAQKTFAYLRFTDDASVGERVIAVGNPLGLSFSVTEGIISAINRVVDETGIPYVQMDVPINQGNSGGPLVNAAKEVVGVNTFKLQATEGLGFAIPSAVAEDIANQAVANDS